MRETEDVESSVVNERGFRVSDGRAEEVKLLRGESSYEVETSLNLSEGKLTRSSGGDRRVTDGTEDGVENTGELTIGTDVEGDERFAILERFSEAKHRQVVEKTGSFRNDLDDISKLVCELVTIDCLLSVPLESTREVVPRSDDLGRLLDVDKLPHPSRIPSHFHIDILASSLDSEFHQLEDVILRFIGTHTTLRNGSNGEDDRKGRFLTESGELEGDVLVLGNSRCRRSLAVGR